MSRGTVGPGTQLRRSDCASERHVPHFALETIPFIGRLFEPEVARGSVGTPVVNSGRVDQWGLFDPKPKSTHETVATQSGPITISSTTSKFGSLPSAESVIFLSGAVGTTREVQPPRFYR